MKFETADLFCNMVVIYYGLKCDISKQCTATVIIDGNVLTLGKQGNLSHLYIN